MYLLVLVFEIEKKNDLHVEKHNSVHNQSKKQYSDLMTQKLTASISSLFTSNTGKCKIACTTRLAIAIDCVRFLLQQGLPFHGHDESKSPINKGNYLGDIHFLVDHD